MVRFTHGALAVFRQVALQVLQNCALALDTLLHELWKIGHVWIPPKQVLGIPGKACCARAELKLLRVAP